ncbi:DUF1327 domain-containing protein [Escherichia coli]
MAYGTSAGSAGYWFYSGLIRSVRHSGLRLVYWGVWFWLPDLSDNLYFKSEKTSVRLHGESNSMTQNYELIVKGIRNFENKVTVTLALRDKKTL